MKKPILPKALKSVQMTLTEHSPEILTGIGIVGMLSAGVLAVRATPKALRLIEEEREEKGEDLTKTEVIKVAWKPYIPAVVTGVTGAACIIGAHSVNAKRNAAIATAYAISEKAFSDYKEKVVETIGEKKEKAVTDAIAKERVEKNPVRSNEVIITEKGNTLCYDIQSGRYFKSDIDKVRSAVNEVNSRLTYENYISLNEFYYEIGLPSIKLGDDLGWNIDGGLIDVNFSSQLAEDGTPCLVIDYRIAPRYDYRHLM